MELSTLVKSFIVFLKLLGCLVAVKADPTCSFEDRFFPSECTCMNYTITCDRKRLPLPVPAQIPRDVHDLTITGYSLGTLNTTKLLGNNLNNLTRLSLLGNGITDITEDSFRSVDFPVLRTLVLENNQISLDIDETSTEQTVIGGLGSLLELNLRNALNETFHKKGNFTMLFERAAFRLRKLILSRNNLILVNPDIFSYGSTRDLEYLEISRAGLSNILDQTFTREKLPYLQLLDLSWNRLGTIKEKTLEDFDQFSAGITRINLVGNPFVCSCDILPFVNWLKKTELVEDKESLLCRDSGVKLVSTHIKCTVPGDRVPDRMSNQHVYTLSIIFAIIGLLALIILFMRRNDIWRFCLQVRQATKEAFDSHQTHYQYSGIYNARRETADSGVASVDV